MAFSDLKSRVLCPRQGRAYINEFKSEMRLLKGFRKNSRLPQYINIILVIKSKINILDLVYQSTTPTMSMNSAGVKKTENVVYLIPPNNFHKQYDVFVRVSFYMHRWILTICLYTSEKKVCGLLLKRLFTFEYLD